MGFATTARKIRRPDVQALCRKFGWGYDARSLTRIVRERDRLIAGSPATARLLDLCFRRVEHLAQVTQRPFTPGAPRRIILTFKPSYRYRQFLVAVRALQLEALSGIAGAHGQRKSRARANGKSSGRRAA